MKIALNSWRKFSGLLFLAIALVAIFGYQPAGAATVQSSNEVVLSALVSDNLAVIEECASFEFPAHSVSKTQSIDWALCEIIIDLPQIALTNSLSLWTNDYSRNTFYVFTNIHAP